MCDSEFSDIGVVGLDTVVKHPNIKLCNYHMFRTINQTITAAKLWREAFRVLQNEPKLGDDTRIILAHFGASASTVNEQSTLSASM